MKLKLALAFAFLLSGPSLANHTWGLIDCYSYSGGVCFASSPSAGSPPIDYNWWDTHPDGFWDDDDTDTNLNLYFCTLTGLEETHNLYNEIENSSARRSHLCFHCPL